MPRSVTGAPFGASMLDPFNVSRVAGDGDGGAGVGVDDEEGGGDEPAAPPQAAAARVPNKEISAALRSGERSVPPLIALPSPYLPICLLTAFSCWFSSFCSARVIWP